LGGIIGDELGDDGRLGLLADEEMVGGENVEGGGAERGVHGLALLGREVYDQTVGGLVVALNLTEAPAPMDAVGTRLHGLEFGFGGLERRVFGDERGDGFGSHGVGNYRRDWSSKRM
jgi:hypothetical protein